MKSYLYSHLCCLFLKTINIFILLRGIYDKTMQHNSIIVLRRDFSPLKLIPDSVYQTYRWFE